MGHRTLPDVGTAFYLPHEERFVQRLLGGDSHTRYQEVEVLHALKVKFGAALLPDVPVQPTLEQMELAADA